MPTKHFALEIIQDAWAEYKARSVLRVLKNGKWEILPLGHDMDQIEGTRAEVVKLSTVQGFPKYLEENYG